MESDKLNELRRAILAEQDDSATLDAAPRMLDIRTLKKGWLALPYESLRRVEFDPDGKVPLRIYFSSHILELQGRNLQAVYRAVASKRLGQLREIGERHDTGEPNDAVVHVLTITEKAKSDQEATGSAEAD
ncbi:MAG: hypothetical protein HND58_10855 [Planctomycetota bacterium]|nr:MAG: hypothetical protein HND58_10855 [Planctomycetota bacterium]